MLASLLSSFCFDYLVRFKGATHLNYALISANSAPPSDSLQDLVVPAAEITCRSEEFDPLWEEVCVGRPRPELDVWEVAHRRAYIDAVVARAYGLSLEQYAAVLSAFPNLDTIQPMLPGEPKSFVTRDLALLACCEHHGQEPGDVVQLLEAAGVELPLPRRDLRRLDVRVQRTGS